MASVGKLLKKANRIQKEVAEVQAKLSAQTVEASSGGGAVKVVVKCDGIVESIRIDPKAIDPQEPALLEDLVLTAVNSGLVKAKELSDVEIGRVTQDFNIPGLIGI